MIKQALEIIDPLNMTGHRASPPLKRKAMATHDTIIDASLFPSYETELEQVRKENQALRAALNGLLHLVKPTRKKDPLEGLPDSHMFALETAWDDETPKKPTITTGQLRRFRALLASDGRSEKTQ